MSKFSKRVQIGMGVATVVMTGQAFGTPYFAECFTHDDGGYRDRVHQVLRESWPDDINPLIVRYAAGVWAERGLGLTRTEDGYNLVRLEFDASLWSSAFRDDFERQDFEGTDVRVASISVPITDALALSIVGALERLQPASGDEPKGMIAPDAGSGAAIIFPDGSCITYFLLGADTGSRAWAIQRLLRYLGDEIESWRWGANLEYERRAMEIIAELRTID